MMKINWNRYFLENVLKNFGLPQEVVLFFGNYLNTQFSTQRSFVWPRSQRVGHPTQRLRRGVVHLVNISLHFFYSTKLKKKENLKATTQYRTRNLCFLTYLLHQTDFITRLIGQISAKFNYKT